MGVFYSTIILVIKFYLISSDGTKTLSWLSQEASERYYKMVGLRPALTLGTKDGAFFSPEDLVKLVLSDNDKVWNFLQVFKFFVSIIQGNG